MRWFWIDRFTEFVCGEKAIAVKNVSLAEEHLHDHFPAHPIMPASLITEGMAQAGGLLVSEAYAFEELVVLGKISKALFHTPVHPGDTLHYHVRVEQIRDSGGIVQVESRRDGELQGEAEIFFARLDAEAAGIDRSLFNPADLLHWLTIVGVFDVGRRPDGTRLTPASYPPFASFA